MSKVVDTFFITKIYIYWLLNGLNNLLISITGMFISKVKFTCDMQRCLEYFISSFLGDILCLVTRIRPRSFAMKKNFAGRHSARDL